MEVCMARLGRAFGKRKDASDGGGAGGLDETIAFDRWHVERSWNARGTLTKTQGFAILAILKE